MPGQPPSGSLTSARSSRTRNSTPPAIHSAAVHTGYSATNSSSALATVDKALLLTTPGDVHPREDEQRDDEAGRRHREAEPDRWALVEHDGGEDERHEPEHRTEDEARDQLAA